MSLSEAQQVRYSRMTIMDEVGEEGQERIVKGRVAVIGMGGLGSPVAMYCAAGGVGSLILMDDDVVEESNLSRQILYTEEDVGRLKVDAAYDRVKAMNGECDVTLRRDRLRATNVEEVVAGVDVVVDGCDNMASKLIVSDECSRQKKPFVFGAVQGGMGEMGIFWPHYDRARGLGLEAGEGEGEGSEGEGSCLRCLYPEDPRIPGYVSRCDLVGVWGAMVGIVGSWQALAVLQLLAHPHKVRRGFVTVVEGRSYGNEVIKVPKRKKCKGCGFCL